MQQQLMKGPLKRSTCMFDSKPLGCVKWKNLFEHLPFLALNASWLLLPTKNEKSNVMKDIIVLRNKIHEG